MTQTKNIAQFLLKNRTRSQTVAKNAFWLGFGNLVSRLIKVALTIYAARVLGTSGYGIFSYALSLVVLFTGFSDIGVGALLTRRVSVAKKVEAPYVATALVIKLALTAISGVLIFFVVPFFVNIPEVMPLLPLVFLLIAVDNARDLPLAITRGEERMEVEAGVQIFTTVVIVSFGIIALYLTRAVEPLLLAYTLGSGAGLILAWALFGKHFRAFWRSFEGGLAKKIVRDAWPFALLGLLGIIMTSTDVIMLGWLRTADEVGLYAAAQKPVEILYTIPAIVAAAVFPVTARLAEKSNEELRALLEKSISLVFLLGLPIVVGGAILARDLITLFYGEPYAGAAATFQILLTTILVMFPSALISHAVFAYNKQRYFVGFLVFGALANVLLNALLIPPYGIVGSAFATVGAQLAANSFVWSKMKKINYFIVMPHLKRTLTASIAMGAVALGLDTTGAHVVVTVVLSVVAYLLFLNILKEPLIGELKRITSGS